MSVGSDPDGGYMVTPAIGSIINGVLFETSRMRAIANIETISSDAIEYRRDEASSRLGASRRPETGTPKAGMQRIPVHELLRQSEGDAEAAGGQCLERRDLA
jgi:HK97 family phage major capsid protein